MNKNIFIIWLQGWETAPDICKMCKLSWKIKNPDWNVIDLDEKSLKNYIPSNILDEYIFFEPIQLYSDLIRLYLIYNYGGLYVDATQFCNKPLNDWLNDNIIFDNVWVSWDFDFTLPNINFLYSKVKNSKYFNIDHKKIDINSVDYHKINKEFYKNLIPISEILKNEKQIGVSSNNTNPKLGIKIIANSFELMNQPLDDKFIDACIMFPFFKLTHKDIPNGNINEIFNKHSKFIYLLLKNNLDKISI